MDAAASAHPNSWFWVKADGVDVVAGLGESLRLLWSGDVDLNDGELSKQYQQYRSRLAFIGALTSTSIHLADDLGKLHRELATDLDYVVKSKFIS